MKKTKQSREKTSYGSYEEFEEKFYPNQTSKEKLKNETPFQFGKAIAAESLSGLLKNKACNTR